MTEPLKDFLSQNPSLLEAQSLPGLPHAMVVEIKELSGEKEK